MPTRSTRDRGMTAMILGFFASAWFGWGHAAASTTLSLVLTIGEALAIALAIVGAIVGFRSPASTSAINDRASGRRYGIVVGTEFAIAGAGAAVLGALDQADYIPAWICFVVGVHFFALVTVLRDRTLIPLGALTTAVGVAAAIVGLTTDIAPSSIAGAGAGALLLIFGIIALAGIRRSTPDSAASPKP